MNDAYLLLGSNEGDREAWMSKAIEFLNKECGTVTKTSRLYQTAAWGVEDQPDYLNQCLILKTELEPTELLFNINQIEHQLGRRRKLKWGQRTLDIDILLYSNTVIESQRLTIPHPHLPERRFALIPLKEIAPKVVHPTINKTISELLDACQDTLKVDEFKKNKS